MTKPSFFTLSCLLVLVSISFLIHEAETKKIPRWWLRVAQKQGPNACVVEEVPGTDLEFWTECRYWLNRHICGTKTRIRFECCEGFEQIDGENGCALVKPLKNILATAESLGATKWAQYIRDSGLENEFESSGAYTLFAPSNEAFDAMSDSLRSLVDSYRGNPNNPVIFYHIVPSKLRSNDFDGDQTIETRHQGHNIRINKYSNGMTTINCALLLRKDQEATNGIVHLIDGFLDPSVGISNNVAEMILNDGRFQVLAVMLEKSGYINVLRTMQDSITILAPSDEAFQKLPDSRREKIINDREARLAILQNHVIPHVICESAITGEHRVRTLSNNRLTFNCDIDGAYVETTKMKGNFNLGKNGIIHMIDDVLLPDRAKNLIELAESRNLETFVQFVKRSGLEETLSHTGDYTFFVPDENAWLEMPPEMLAKTRRDPEFAGLMLRYHGAYGRHLTNAITDNQAIMSLDEENPVRLQVWRKALGVEDAKITESDIEAQNGVIHIINKVIFPSNRSVEDVLASLSRYSFYTFLRMLQQVTSDPESSVSLRPGEDRFYTFFVTSDRAFSRISQDELNSIMADPLKTRQFVENHIALNMFPEISFEPGLTYSIEGIGDNNYNIKKSPTGELTVNGVKVLGSHMSAKGVIHVIDDVFIPEANSNHFTSVKRTYSSSTDGKSSSSTRTTYTTHHRVTLNEGYENDLDDILPAYPKGSVIAGSKKRKTSYTKPKSKIARRRENRIRTRIRSKNKVIRKTTSHEKSEEIVPEESPFKAHESHAEEVVQRHNSIPPPSSTSSKSNSSSAIEGNKQHDNHEDDINMETSKSNKTAFSAYNNFDVDQTSITGRYNYSGAIYAYPASLSGSRYDTYFANKSSANLPTTIGFAYNYSWPSSSDHYRNNSLYNLTLPLSNSGYNYSQSSSSFSSHISSNDSNSFTPINSRTPFNLDRTPIPKLNTIGPVSPAGRKFSYVGHPYGEDVVGHDSQYLPFSSAGSSFVSRNESSSDIQMPNQGDKKNKSPFAVHRKRVHKTHTIYTYPSGKLSRYLRKSTRIITQPGGGRGMVATDNNNTNPHFISAYAFTGDDQDFADGTEFSEVRGPSEEVITAEQAKILRRQWRKKRHHQRRNRNKQRRRMRKGHHRGHKRT